ncbi:MAG: zinc-dependent metalloprotease, partial [Planctomycetota bacterium]
MCFQAAIALVAALSTSAPDSKPSFAERASELSARHGLLKLHVDVALGRVWLALPEEQDDGILGEFIHVSSIARGLGSNPVGLDRGRLGPSEAVRFRRRGNSVHLERINLAFRANTNRLEERRAVEESFASSTLWSFPIVTHDSSRYVNLSPFLLSDDFGVSQILSASDQGSFSVDRDRSAVITENCVSFPRNSELEATLTFSGKKAGNEVRATSPRANSVTLRVHHSFVAFPKPGYEPRIASPTSGYLSISFQDYAAPLAETIRKRLIVRHRLEKQNPAVARSAVKQPIVYYVDPGAPEEIQSALIEGASWWNEAFEAAGFEDAFRVEVLPTSAHPLDVRYNVIQWVHRATRGWSIGRSIIDPRSGEIIKGHVTLGSLRVRHDQRLFEALIAPNPDRPRETVELALARLRQLSAHEVGHTLGLAHNFAASTYDGRASVMDYPAPLIRVVNGELRFDDAYGVGIGSWDKHAIRYGYSHWPAGTDVGARLRELDHVAAREHRFLSDSDARPLGSSHPLAHLWDNGDDPVDELDRVREVRRIGIERFDRKHLRPGWDLSQMVALFTPLYLHHRYQVHATVKLLGGRVFRHASSGHAADIDTTVQAVSPVDQHRALRSLVRCLEPSFLDIPDRVLTLLPPPSPGSSRDRERFSERMFHAPTAAAVAADLVIDGLLERSRCARLIDQHRRDPNLPGLSILLRELEQIVSVSNDPDR